MRPPVVAATKAGTRCNPPTANPEGDRSVRTEEEWREKARQYAREYYWRNRANRLEKARRFREANREKVQAQRRKSRAANLDKETAYAKAYKAKHAERVTRTRRSVNARATRKWRRWTADEDALVLDDSRTIAELGDTTGRSYNAIVTRRRRLRSGQNPAK